jgi:magnesium-transporting ATPase (P-type)
MEMGTPNTPSETPAQAPAGPAVAAGGIAVKPNGPAVAVMIATGIGTLVLGILTTLSEASEGVSDFLKWSDRVGPLSGKTILAVVAFLVSWGGLHVALRNRDVDWRPAITALIVLFAIALVLVFPPFFQLFESD